MNILPKKKWHVRTKENMARVRRDEAKAAAEEAARAERATLADNEDRVRRLKSRNRDESGTLPEAGTAEQAGNEPTSSQLADTFRSGTMRLAEGEHVNFFAELEEQDRKNLAEGNAEYAAEKKKERDDWESKMGIMKRFAEDTKEYAKEKYWWENIPLVRTGVTDDGRSNALQRRDEQTRVAPEIKRRLLEHCGLPVPARKTASVERLKELERKARKRLRKERRLEKKAKKEDRKRKKRGRRRSSSSSTSSSSSSTTSSDTASLRRTKAREIDSASKQIKLERMRAERLARERAEKERAQRLLESRMKPEGDANAPDAFAANLRSQLDEERKRRYNPQFNPDFAK